MTKEGDAPEKPIRRDTCDLCGNWYPLSDLRFIPVFLPAFQHTVRRLSCEVCELGKWAVMPPVDLEAA